MMALLPAAAFCQRIALQATRWKLIDGFSKKVSLVRIAGVAESSQSQVRARARREVQAWLNYIPDLDLHPFFKDEGGLEVAEPFYVTRSGDNSFPEVNTWTVVATLLRKGFVKIRPSDLPKMPQGLVKVYVESEAEARALRAGMWKRDASRRAITVVDALRWELWDPIKKTQRSIRVYGFLESRQPGIRRKARELAQKWVDDQSEGDIFYDVRSTDVDFVDAVSPWAQVTSLIHVTKESSFGLELLRLGLLKLNKAEPILPDWLAKEARANEAEARRHHRGIWRSAR